MVLFGCHPLLEELERQKAEITVHLTEAPANAPDVRPNVAELYRAQVARLTDALASPETHAQAAADVRSLIGEVVITPGAGRGEFTAVLRGELLGILDLVGDGEGPPGPEVITNAIPCPRSEPMLRSGANDGIDRFPPPLPLNFPVPPRRLSVIKAEACLPVLAAAPKCL
jgi:hypothetical protein